MAEPQWKTLSSVLSSHPTEIKSWDAFQEHLKTYRADNRYKFCFRGQANSNWALTPSLERLVSNRRQPSISEVERILIDRFKRQAHYYLPTLPEEDSTIEWIALMQHWGMPTRLLDFTLSPYIALFSALTERQIGCTGCVPTHCAVWAISHVVLQSLAKREMGLKGGSGGQAFRRKLDQIVGRGSNLRFVAPIQPYLMNERLARQQGLFLCPSHLKLPFEILISQPEDFRMFVGVNPGTLVPGEPMIKDTLARKLIIPVDQRPNMLRELSRMNINSASLFPGLDGYAKSIRESYESLEDEQPSHKRNALDTIEDFGWPG